MGFIDLERRMHVDQMGEEVNRAVVDSVREMCGSVMVKEKTPKSMVE